MVFIALRWALGWLVLTVRRVPYLLSVVVWVGAMKQLPLIRLTFYLLRSLGVGLSNSMRGACLTMVCVMLTGRSVEARL